MTVILRSRLALKGNNVCSLLLACFRQVSRLFGIVAVVGWCCLTISLLP